jgi:amidophosphoribosyltransferase
MSDQIKHECGIALVRLLKPLHFYLEKYGTSFYGLSKLYLLMEKQHNRGQDGAGVVNVKIDTPPGIRFISRYRSVEDAPLKDIFGKINSRFQKLRPEQLSDPQWLKLHHGFTGELFLGHLRYGTYGENKLESCHPFLRLSNWKTRNLAVAGNFNLTNVDDLFDQLVELGQHPKEKADTVTVMERIGHFLDVENDRLLQHFSSSGLTGEGLIKEVSDHLDLVRILKESSRKWDGGYAMAGLIGNGDAFVLRDPWGIRPAYYYQDEEVAVVCSERPVIQTAFNVSYEHVKELKPGHALLIRKSGKVEEQAINPASVKKSCSFERIYFSRGSDQDIYKERKALGKSLCTQVLNLVQHDLQETVFSFIPNTAEVAFLGLIKGLEEHLMEYKRKLIMAAGADLTEAALQEILTLRPRVEKVAIKDAKLRTFITDDANRDEMVSHVYDITYGTLRQNIDSLVVLDDSIVRGTTLRQSILKMLDRLHPRRIIIVSSAPQIRYPDCYGIDMARMGDFIAFQAAISLIKERGMESMLDLIYQDALKENQKPLPEIINVVRRVYEPFTADEISQRIAYLLKPSMVNAEVIIVYQSIEGLHASCPENQGDWYFTGHYPTPGGNKVANKAFINYIEGNSGRAY